MGTRLYCEFSDSVLETLLACDADRLRELKSLKKTAERLERLTRDEEDDLDFGLYQLVQEIPQLAALRGLEISGFGKFDLDLLPDHSQVHGRMLITEELARQVVDSTYYAEAHPGLYRALVLAGCREIWWS